MEFPVSKPHSSDEKQLCSPDTAPRSESVHQTPLPVAWLQSYHDNHRIHPTHKPADYTMQKY